MAINSRQVLILYKSMLREAEKFSSFNYRHYALRRIKHTFRMNQEIQDAKMIAEKIEEAKRILEVIKRQVIVGQLYGTDKLVIEYAQNVKQR